MKGEMISGVDERLKKVNEFLEVFSKKFDALKGAIMIKVFEREYKILALYVRGKGLIDEGYLASFKFQENVYKAFTKKTLKDFIVFNFNTEKRAKIYPWFYSDVSANEVYDYFFPLSKKENIGVVVFITERELSLDEIDEVKDIFFKRIGKNREYNQRNP